jgi:hypothetical protein
MVMIGWYPSLEDLIHLRHIVQTYHTWEYTKNPKTKQLQEDIDALICGIELAVNSINESEINRGQ